MGLHVVVDVRVTDGVLVLSPTTPRLLRLKGTGGGSGSGGGSGGGSGSGGSGSGSGNGGSEEQMVLHRKQEEENEQKKQEERARIEKEKRRLAVEKKRREDSEACFRLVREHQARNNNGIYDEMMKHRCEFSRLLVLLVLVGAVGIGWYWLILLVLVDAFSCPLVHCSTLTIFFLHSTDYCCVQHFCVQYYLHLTITVERHCSVCRTKASCRLTTPPPPATATTTTTPPTKDPRPACMYPRRTTTWSGGCGHCNEWRRNAWRSKKQGNESNAPWSETGTSNVFLERLLRFLFATSMPGRVALWDLSYSPMFFVLIFGVFLFDVAIILYLAQS
jgi:hypothetical protein